MPTALSSRIKLTALSALSIMVAASASNVLAASPKHKLRPGSAERLAVTKKAMDDIDVKYKRGIRVTASPFLGTFTLYDINSLLVNQPSMNEDLVLLEQHALSDKSWTSGNVYAYPGTPLVDISGAFAPSISYNTDYSGGSSSSLAINRAEVDFGVYASPWITGYLSLAYKGTGADKNAAIVKRGWVTVGNLNEAPVYFSLGQMYVPFGSYSSNMLSDPIVKTLFRISAPTAVLGYASQVGPGNLYAQAYGYQGPVSESVKAGTIINGWGAGLGYKGKYASHVGYDVGVGYTNNIANASGQMAVVYPAGQVTGGGSNSGFNNDGSKKLAHNVAGLDVHVKASFDNISMVGEWISALRDYSASDLQYNAKRARISAMHVEGNYAFDFMGRNSGVFLGYDRSWQSLALGVPEQSITTGVSSSPWHYTIATLEYRHDMNYKKGDTAAIANGSAAASAASAVTSTGGGQNTVSFQFGLYF